MVRYAFTMIELIFAIVIIGIIAISIPTVMLNNARSLEQNLMQEGILIAATKTGQALTYAWDENSRDPNSNILAKTEALNINEGTFEDELDRNISDFRRGHFQEALRRRLTPESLERDATDDTLLGLDAGDLNISDDIDDIDGQATLITHIGEDGYKNDYNLTTGVVYVDDQTNYAAGGATPLSFNFANGGVTRATNIKMVEVNVTKEAGTLPDIVLRTFVSNLGETDYYKRTY